MTAAFRLLLAAALPVFFLSLGANAIWDANEAFYVETPRQMVLTGDYLTPTFNGEPRLNKPVLSYWMVAGLYQLFGVSVGVERLGIALGAMVLIAATFLIGRAVGTPFTGALAALMIATAPRVVMFSRRIFIDVWIAAWLALALAGFVLAVTRPAERRRYLTLMYVAIGLGVLTKGPVALVLPALAAGLWLVAERRLADLGRLMLLPGAAIVVAIAAPWYLALYVQHGWEPIGRFVMGENVGRFTTPLAPGDRDWAFYLPVLFGDLFPWAPLLVVPFVTVWRRGGDPAASVRRLLWFWIVGTTVLFSFSATKQDLYIFPVVPAVAVLVADALVRFEFGRAHRALTGLLALVLLLCLVAAAAVARLFGGGYYAMTDAVPVAVVLAATGLAGLVAVWRGRGRAAVAALAAGFVAFNYLFVVRVLPEAERLAPVPPIARVFSERASVDADLASFNMMLPSLVYYTARPVRGLASPDEAAAALSDTREIWVLTGAREWEVLDRRVPQACVAERRHLFPFSARLADLAAGRPPADVLLVTNRCGTR